MRAIIIDDKDAQQLLRELEHKRLELKSDLKGKPTTFAIEDVHRAFHYVVCKWLQEQGADVIRRG